MTFKQGNHESKIHFNDNNKNLFQSLGRNGYMHCNGLDIWAFRTTERDCVRLSPINSKDNIGRSFVEFPVNEIDKLIKELKMAKRYIKKIKKQNKSI